MVLGWKELDLRLEILDITPLEIPNIFIYSYLFLETFGERADLHSTVSTDCICASTAPNQFLTSPGPSLVYPEETPIA